MALPPDPTNPLGDAWGFGKGVAAGVGDGVKSVVDLAKGGYTLATDPTAREQAWQTAKQLARAGQDYAGRAYNDPAQAFSDAKDGANRLYSAFEQARDAAAARGESAEFWGQAAGRTAFEVGSLLIPVGAATKLGKLAEGAKAADQIVDGLRAADKLAEGGAAAAKAEAVAAKAAATADMGYEVLPCGKTVEEFSAVNPGPLADHLAETFSGGRYREIVLEEDTIMRRAGVADKPLGQFFSQETASSVIQTRIDKAVLPKWASGAISPIDTEFEVLIPKGTKVYVGEVSSQGGFYVGGTPQTVIPEPWKIPGVQVLSQRPLK